MLTAERAAGALFRRAEPPPVPSPAVFAAMRQRLLAPAPRLWLPPGWMRVAIAAASLCVTVEVGVAVVRYRPQLARLVLSAVTIHGHRPPAPSHPARADADSLPSARELPPLAALPAVELMAPLAATPAPLSAPRAVRRAAPAPSLAPPQSVPAPALSTPAVVPAVVIDTALSREAAALAPAFAALNQRGDPASALQLLRDYRSGFPQGALGSTADLLELRALLATGANGAALERLNGFAARDFRGVAGAPELRVLRGELLAHDGALERALAAFDGALAGALEPDLRERALFGRASALERQGNLAASRVASAQYLKEYPRGRFAAELRKASAAER